MKTSLALSMLLSPFSLPHDERWVLPLALGLFALLAVFSAWRLKTEEGSALYFAPLTGIVFLCVLSEALVYGVYLLAKKKRRAAM